MLEDQGHKRILLVAGEELLKIPDEKVREKTRENLKALEAGERDMFF